MLISSFPAVARPLPPPRVLIRLPGMALQAHFWQQPSRATLHADVLDCHEQACGRTPTQRRIDSRNS
jgi:hypothetical protein